MTPYAASAREDGADAATVLSEWLAEIGVELSDNQLECLPDRDLHLRSGEVIDVDDEEDMRLGICRSGMLIAEQPCGHDKTDRVIVAIHLPGEILMIDGLFGNLTRQSVRRSHRQPWLCTIYTTWKGPSHRRATYASMLLKPGRWRPERARC